MIAQADSHECSGQAHSFDCIELHIGKMTIAVSGRELCDLHSVCAELYTQLRRIDDEQTADRLEKPDA